MTRFASVIFLDVDGVLNCDSTPETDGLVRLEAAVVFRFLGLAHSARAHVVLSSCWRWSSVLMGILEANGVPVDDVTAWIHGVARSVEITRWLDEHPGVARFVVLDDDSDARTPGGLFVHVDSAVGLTDGDVRRAAEHLRRAS